MDFPFGSLIGAGASLLGGFLNRDANEAARREASVSAEEQRRLQKQFATEGLQWRANDAMRAYKATGIHPLSMLGVNAPSYSPVNFVGSGNTAMGDAISNAGQSIARSVEATSNQRERLSHAARLDGLVMERAGLENDLLRMRIASEAAQLRHAANPSNPVGNRWLLDGQGQAPVLVKDKPMERTPPDISGNVSAEPGAVTDIGYSRTRSGYAPTRSKDLQDRAEDDAIGSVTWNIRNRLLPTFGISSNPPFKAPMGFEWRYMPFHQEYRLYKLPGTFKRIE